MRNINTYRTFLHNQKPVNTDGGYVLYWMQTNRRLHYNYALERAVEWANELGKPLLIFEGLTFNYPWASNRTHTYILQGMAENLEEARRKGINYYSYVELEQNSGTDLLFELAQNACCIISDEYPILKIRTGNERLAKKVEIRFITVDSNGLIPLGISSKAPYSAFIFRRIMQKHFLEAFTNPPKEHPLNGLRHQELIEFTPEFEDRYPSAEPMFKDIQCSVQGLQINHSIKPVEEDGSRSAALMRMHEFMNDDLADYGERRNHPDEPTSSQLSAWLHFGKISEYEVVKAALNNQPEDWELTSVTPNGGKRIGFFKGNTSIESFLDELITWRGTGFHFAHHRQDYRELSSLPDWVKKTMNKHQKDERSFLYTFEELEMAHTHDELWNAAQRQLVQKGYIHNYMRMLWGKKVIEWTPDYHTALQYLIELNNKYALDGDDPNSYSGIFWCFGRFDRAWQERPVFGKLRYMSSENTRKKVRLHRYLKEFGRPK